jgi:hypothetical protein
MSKLCWRPMKEGVIVPAELYMPSKRRKPIDLLLDFDLFAHDDQTIDVILAVVASSGSTRFFYETEREANRKAYLKRLKQRGREAGKRYEAEMRAHFKKYKYEFREGYSLPEPPTPELRAIYDSAATWEKRPTNPCGTTLHSGFSLGEYHWRSWPLSNLIDENDLSIPK